MMTESPKNVSFEFLPRIESPKIKFNIFRLAQAQKKLSLKVSQLATWSLLGGCIEA